MRKTKLSQWTQLLILQLKVSNFLDLLLISINHQVLATLLLQQRVKRISALSANNHLRF